MSDSYDLARPDNLGCPECSGVLWEERHADLLVYRCHIGHRLTAQTLLHAQRRRLEERLESCLALLNERAELCRRLAELAPQRDAGGSAGIEEAARQEAVQLAELLGRDWLLPERDADTGALEGPETSDA